MDDDRRLLTDKVLEASEVVANAAMNRERGLTGVNSYARDLAFDPLEFLRKRLQNGGSAAWLDLCCGTGRALVQAAERLYAEGLADRVSLVGVDLMPLFCPVASPESRCLERHAASLAVWEPGERRFDLITCVHGLHYVGDKLGLLARAVSWLTPDGVFIGHLDTRNVRINGAGKRAMPVHGMLVASGFTYRPARHTVSCVGRKSITFPARYLGASDRAGPNFSGQPAVDSFYEMATISSVDLPPGVST